MAKAVKKTVKKQKNGKFGNLPGPGPGRPKGKPNKATLEQRAFFREFLESEEYRKNAKARIMAGEASHLETLAHHYAYGKPKDTVDVNSKVSLIDMIAISKEED